jgi:hypothetical protein
MSFAKVTAIESWLAALGRLIAASVEILSAVITIIAMIEIRDFIAGLLFVVGLLGYRMATIAGSKLANCF